MVVIEALNPRRLFAGVALSDGILSVEGTNEPDRVEFEYRGAQTAVFLNGQATVVDTAAIRAISITTGNGDDFVALGRRTTPRDGVLVDAGNGADSIGGSSKSDTLLGGNGDDYLDGREGDDYLDSGRGDDILYGYLGRDVLHGDNGNDSAITAYGFYGSAVEQLRWYDAANRTDIADTTLLPCVELTISKKQTIFSARLASPIGQVLDSLQSRSGAGVTIVEATLRVDASATTQFAVTKTLNLGASGEQPIIFRTLLAGTPARTTDQLTLRR